MLFQWHFYTLFYTKFELQKNLFFNKIIKLSGITFCANLPALTQSVKDKLDLMKSTDTAVKLVSQSYT